MDREIMWALADAIPSVTSFYGKGELFQTRELEAEDLAPS